jgi:ELWxxDGT repeat protein
MRRALRIFALLTLAPLLAAAAEGPAHLIADLNPGVETFDPDASANAAFGSYTAVNGRVIFLAFFPKTSPWSYQFQCGLWVTDGTAGSAEPLADLCGEEENPQHFVRILGSKGSLAYFTDSGDRLWRTDGTAAGTFPVARVVVSGSTAFAPDGRLFFTGCPPGKACHPWTSDGTSRGTGPVGDAPPAGDRYGLASSYVFAGPLALYAAGNAIWASDGTRQGTFQLARVTAPDGIGDLVVQGGRLYFAAFDGARVTLWAADPVTRKVRRIRSFAFDSEEGGFGLFPAGGRLLVVSSDGRATALWETDGTPAGTRQLGPPLAYNGFIDRVFDVGGRAVFAAPRGHSATPRIWSLEPGAKRPLPLPGPADLSHARVFDGRLYYLVRDADGYVLRVTDGTAPGTRFLKDLCPQGCEVAPVGLQEALGRLVIATPDGTLWVTDGTAAGTLPFARQPPQLYSLQRDFLVATAHGRAIFTGFDPVNGPQPWTSDLTPGGSGPIENVGGNLAAGSRISVLSSVGPKALFPTCDGVDEGIWASDGTEAGTAPLPGTPQPCEKPPGPFTFFYRVGGLTYFSWKEQIWRTDGTPAGTVPLLDLSPSYPWLYSAAPLGGRLFFYPVPAEPAQGPFVFWTSDGTPAGTRAAFSLSTGPSGPFIAAGNLVFFEAGRTSPPYGIDLWRTDGTESGTRPLLQIVPEILNETPPVVWTGSRYIFLAAGVQRGGEELELWASDGTAAGTAPVIADTNAPRPFKPLGLVAFRGVAYFFAGGDSGHPSALWRTDGTAAGTFPLKTVGRPSNSQALDGLLTPELTPVGDQLFFRADDGVHGSEIWKTDGTAAGTVLVRDIAPGAAHASPEWLTAAGGKLYFGAFDPEHGYELWGSDGTEAGTRLVQDIVPGPAPSNPQLLTPAEGALYFTADDGEHGREPWVLPLQR